ncbi:efflux RND transporter periplasmic adaptor subunit [Sphingomonas sp.]|uniref:efflux RND transporter periplasmic adaptor subunit n=1 Tax=Sphingomonas sp. TaxID=28214 RepID=UPI00286C63CD|nr:efflux RND transporter periplasmic adaptor subunit [Sphingomonas sp.]
MLIACGGAEGAERKRPIPTVRTEAVTNTRFADRVEAVGTANANEQVTLSAPVTERLVRINFDDGGYVLRGQTVAVLAAGQERAQLAEAQAVARNANQQLRRVSELKRRGFATNSSLDSQVALSSAARAQAAEASASIGDRVITAPFSGWVSLRSISPGAIVAAGTEIATISDVRIIKLDFPVPETLLPLLRRGLPITVTSAAWPSQPFRGMIANIDPVIDPNTRSVVVRAELPNADRRLRPGMLLNVVIDAAPREGLSVPELAVVGEGDCRFVYLIDAQGKAQRSEVRTGARMAGRIEIVSGLRVGQKVVTEGVIKLTDGMKVKVAGPARRQGSRPAAGAN